MTVKDSANNIINVGSDVILIKPNLTRCRLQAANDNTLSCVAVP
jgi:hypothetical protein